MLKKSCCQSRELNCLLDIKIRFVIIERNIKHDERQINSLMQIDIKAKNKFLESLQESTSKSIDANNKS